MKYHFILLIGIILTDCVQAQQFPEPSPPKLGYTYKVEPGVGAQQVYISGQRPFNAKGELVGIGNLAIQAGQVFQNLTAALSQVGMSINDVRQVTYHLKGLPGVVNPVDSQLIVGIAAPFLAKANVTVQEIKSLEQIGQDGVLLEVEVIAVR